MALHKAQASAEARKFDSQVLVDYRLAPDMLPFTRQVLIACDGVNSFLAKEAGLYEPLFRLEQLGMLPDITFTMTTGTSAAGNACTSNDHEP